MRSIVVCVTITTVYSNCCSSSVAITCTSLVAVMNGTITYTPDTTVPFDYETTASFSCDNGFYLVGDPTRICGGTWSNDQWSGSAPSCQGESTKIVDD